MAKLNHLIVFGDIVKDTETDRIYTCVATANGKRGRVPISYIVCLELDQNFNGLSKTPVPFDRLTLKDFKLLVNKKEHAAAYIQALELNIAQHEFANVSIRCKF